MDKFQDANKIYDKQMSNIKDTLIKLCSNLEANLNEKSGDTHHKVKITCELKPSDYFLPQFHPGTSETVYLQDNKQEAFFVELWLDDKCLYRKSGILPDDSPDTRDDFENYFLDELLNLIFRYGVISINESLLK